MSDVAAVVLSMGEAVIARAVASIEEQSQRPAQVVRVDGLAPFHRALNYGAQRVEQPVFLQVDADMVLDPHCLAALRAVMSERCACVVGHLRDPLIGRVVGIKLFRTDLLRGRPFRDAISPDTDFLDEMAERGWSTVYATRYEGRRAQWHTFGVHSPEYQPLYTFSKHVLEGSRYIQRESVGGLRWHIEQLLESRHPSRLYAVAGLAVGAASRLEGDQLKPYDGDLRLEALLRYLSRAASKTPHLPWLWGFTPGSAHRHGLARGRRAARSASGSGYLAALDGLEPLWHPYAWLLALGFAGGLVGELLGETEAPPCPLADSGPRGRWIKRTRYSLRQLLVQLRRVWKLRQERRL